MERAGTAEARVSLKWGNGKWRCGTKVRTPKNSVVLRSCICASIAYDTRRVGRF